MVTISITAVRWSASKRVEALQRASKRVEALAIADYRSPRNVTRSRNGNRPLHYQLQKTISSPESLLGLHRRSSRLLPPKCKS